MRQHHRAHACRVEGKIVVDLKRFFAMPLHQPAIQKVQLVINGNAVHRSRHLPGRTPKSQTHRVLETLSLLGLLQAKCIE